MQADFSVELGADDPTLALPWVDPEGKFAYYDLRKNPAAIAEVPEAKAYSALSEFLTTLNSSSSKLQSVKCDVWFTDELNEEDEVFDAKGKFGSYVDAIFHSAESQASFDLHEGFAARLVELLKRAPELQGSVEVIIRRAHFEDSPSAVREGCYFTIYVFGFGDDEPDARQAWGIALRLVGHAILQISAGRETTRPSPSHPSQA